MPRDHKREKRPTDVNQWAKRMVELATMDEEERAAIQKKLAKQKSKRHKPG
jgi:hypothetical protein